MRYRIILEEKETVIWIKTCAKCHEYPKVVTGGQHAAKCLECQKQKKNEYPAHNRHLPKQLLKYSSEELIKGIKSGSIVKVPIVKKTSYSIWRVE